MMKSITIPHLTGGTNNQKAQVIEWMASINNPVLLDSTGGHLSVQMIQRMYDEAQTPSNNRPIVKVFYETNETEHVRNNPSKPGKRKTAARDKYMSKLLGGKNGNDILNLASKLGSRKAAVTILKSGNNKTPFNVEIPLSDEDEIGSLKLQGLTPSDDAIVDSAFREKLESTITGYLGENMNISDIDKGVLITDEGIEDFRQMLTVYHLAHQMNGPLANAIKGHIPRKHADLFDRLIPSFDDILAGENLVLFAHSIKQLPKNTNTNINLEGQDTLLPPWLALAKPNDAALAELKSNLSNREMETFFQILAGGDLAGAFRKLVSQVRGVIQKPFTKYFGLRIIQQDDRQARLFDDLIENITDGLVSDYGRGRGYTNRKELAKAVMHSSSEAYDRRLTSTFTPLKITVNAARRVRKFSPSGVNVEMLVDLNTVNAGDFDSRDPGVAKIEPGMYYIGNYDFRIPPIGWDRKWMNATAQIIHEYWNYIRPNESNAANEGFVSKLSNKSLNMPQLLYLIGIRTKELYNYDLAPEEWLTIIQILGGKDALSENYYAGNYDSTKDQFAKDLENVGKLLAKQVEEYNKELDPYRDIRETRRNPGGIAALPHLTKNSQLKQLELMKNHQKKMRNLLKSINEIDRLRKKQYIKSRYGLEKSDDSVESAEKMKDEVDKQVKDLKKKLGESQTQIKKLTDDLAIVRGGEDAGSDYNILEKLTGGDIWSAIDIYVQKATKGDLIGPARRLGVITEEMHDKLKAKPSSSPSKAKLVELVLNALEDAKKSDDKGEREEAEEVAETIVVGVVDDELEKATKTTEEITTEIFAIVDKSEDTMEEVEKPIVGMKDIDRSLSQLALLEIQKFTPKEWQKPTDAQKNKMREFMQRLPFDERTLPDDQRNKFPAKAWGRYEHFPDPVNPVLYLGDTGKVAVLGDTHGDYTSNNALINHIQEKYPEAKVVWLGDTVDGGRSRNKLGDGTLYEAGISDRKNMSIIEKLNKKDPNKYIPLQGNHERYLLAGAMSPAPFWVHTYNEGGLKAMLKEELIFSLRPFFVIAGKTIMMHGGFPKIPGPQAKPQLYHEKDVFNLTLKEATAEEALTYDKQKGILWNRIEFSDLNKPLTNWKNQMRELGVTSQIVAHTPDIGAGAVRKRYRGVNLDLEKYYGVNTDQDYRDAGIAFYDGEHFLASLQSNCDTSRSKKNEIEYFVLDLDKNEMIIEIFGGYEDLTHKKTMVVPLPDDGPKNNPMNCGCGQTPCKTYGTRRNPTIPMYVGTPTGRVKNLGSITAIVQVGRNIIKDVGEGIQDIYRSLIGGRQSMTEKRMAMAVAEMQADLERECLELGGNVVGNIQIDYEYPATGSDITLIAVADAFKTPKKNPASNYHKYEKKIISILKKEGGAAGLKALRPAFPKGTTKAKVVGMLKKMNHVVLHADGDYILIQGLNNPDEDEDPGVSGIHRFTPPSAQGSQGARKDPSRFAKDTLGKADMSRLKTDDPAPLNMKSRKTKKPKPKKNHPELMCIYKKSSRSKPCGTPLREKKNPKGRYACRKCGAEYEMR